MASDQEDHEGPDGGRPETDEGGEGTADVGVTAPAAEPETEEPSAFEPVAGSWDEAPVEPVAEAWDETATAWDADAAPDEPPAPAADGPAPRRPPGRRPPGRAARGRRPSPMPARPARAAPAAPSQSRRGLVIALTVLSVIVVLLAVGGVLLARSGNKAASSPPTTAGPSTTLATLPDAGFTTFTDTDPQFSFTIRYPRGWVRSDAPVKEIRLTVSDGKQFSARVRVIHTEEATTPGNIGNLKPTIEGFLGSNIQLAKSDPVTVNGLIGFRYIYNYTASDTGLTGAHVRYFLFQGHKMNDIIFEAVPSDSFGQMEGVFDQMLQSFHSDPEPATSSSTPSG